MKKIYIEYLQEDFLSAILHGATKKVYLVPQKWKKKPKIHMGSIRRSLQAQPNIIKKNYWNTKSTNLTKKILQKSIFSTLKMKRSQKIVWKLPNGICMLDSKSLKKLLEHQIDQSDRIFFQKNYIFRTLKGERSQKFVWGPYDRICRLYPKS
jgi:hypothetical protein